MYGLVVASGKGGTGKSFLASSFALLLSEKKKIVACDCDVDTPSLGLWLGITNYDYIEQIVSSEKAIVRAEKCKGCGECIRTCRFDAVKIVDGRAEVNYFLCEGCGACQIVCKTHAIDIIPVENGEIRINTTQYKFPLVSGSLYPGESSSGKIVEELKKRASNFNAEIGIFDAAAGTGCPVIASVRGSNYAVLVAEPTPSGFSDLKRIAGVVNHFNIPFGIVINKWNINKDVARKIERWCGGRKLLGKIEYRKEIIDSIVRLEPVVNRSTEIRENVKEILEKIEVS